MTNKKLIILGIVAVVMAGLAILQNQMSRNVHTADFSSSALVEGLDVEAISAVQVSSEKGTKTVTLARKNGQFVVVDKDNYPADVSKINSLINKCLDVRTTEKITSNPDNHADLKVTEDTAQTVIAFLDNEQKPIVTLLFSDRNAETNVGYGRLLNEDDVYAIQSPPWFQTGATDYMDTQLLDVERGKIKSVAVKTPEDSYILSSPEGSDDVQLETMPDGKQYKGTDYKTVFGALSGLRFEDVSKPENAPDDLSFDYTYTCKLYDLTVYKLTMAKKDDKTYLKVSADFLDKTPVEKKVGEVESDEELKKKEAKLLATDAVKEFNAKHKHWVYQIPSYQAGNLTKSLSEIVEDIPAPEPEKGAEGSDVEQTQG